MTKNLLFLLLFSFSCSICLAQTKNISGKVTAKSDGLPLPGVSVTVKGTTTGSQTDADGNFSFAVGSNAKTLVVTYIGYKQKEVVINSGVIAIVLEENQQSLSEIIVTGYLPQNKREVSGSIATISAEKFSQVPIGSFDQALQGQAAGVLVQANSGQPGAAASILIRGRGSVLGGTSPLYILDGVEITAADFSSLNSNDFASVSVLKDAVSTSQYGSRGANGVIVITSRQGQVGRPVIRYDAQFGKSRAPENKLVVMNTAQKLDYELANGNPNGWTTAELDALRLIETDWEDVFFKTGTTKSHNLSVSGGSDKTKFLLSGGYFDQTGTVPTTKLKRYTGRVNVSSSTKDLDFGLNSAFGYSDYTNTSEANTGIATPLNALRWTNPYLAPYNPDGTYSQNPTGQPNPLPELLENKNLSGQIKTVGNVYATYHVPGIAGLYARANVGADYTSNEANNFNDPITTTGAAQTGGRGSLTRGYNKLFRYTITSSIGYSRKFGTDHSLTATVFNEVIKATASNFAFTGYGLGGPFENESGITPGNATNGYIPAVSGGGEGNALLSYFANVNYGYKDRYFLQVGARRDGSSRFGSNKRYANFGSLGLSWIVSSEPFFESLKDNVFSDFKFKVSYGSAGNQSGIGSFEARETYGRAVYNGVSGLLQTQLAKPDLQWERKTTFNTGIEFTAINGRIGGTFEYYNAVTSDLFLNRQLSRTTGFSSINTNIGELRNRGIEASLNGDVVKSKSFTWNLSANFTYNRNKITKLYNGQNQIISGLTILKPGESINSLYVVRSAGVNPANGNAVYLDKDGNTTETYSDNNRVIVGSTEAPYFGGFGTRLNYKGVEISGLFSFVSGNKIFNNDRTNVENPTYLTDNLSVDMLNEWRKAGDVTIVPRASQTLQTGTSRFVEKGDFLRLRNVMLSYTLPAKYVSAVKFSSARIFLQGQNLMTWTQFKGFDPELATSTLTGAQYPALRTVTIGLNIAL